MNQTMPTPKFLAATEADRASWREVPMSKALVEYLDWEEARCGDGILAAVRAGRSKEAEILSGKLEAIQELIAVIWRKDAPVPQAEEEFVDPAAIWRTP